MDPKNSLKEVVRCHLCESPVTHLHCVICNIHLCENCKEKHLFDEYKEHILIPFKYRGSISKCRKQICEHYCEQCNIPICAPCVSSKEHQMHVHDVEGILKSLDRKKTSLQRDLQYLEKTISSKYQDILSKLSDKKKSFLIENSQKLSTKINKHGEEWHRKIDTIIQKLKSDLDEMNSKVLAALTKQEVEITRTISDIYTEHC